MADDRKLPIESVDSTSIKERIPGSRRDFAFVSVASIASTILAACGGKATFAAKNRIVTIDVPIGDDNSVGGTEGPNEPVATEDPNSENQIISEPPGPPVKPPAPGDTVAPEQRLATGDAELGDNELMLFKFYGTKTQTLFAMARKSPDQGLFVGDMIFVLNPDIEKQGKIIAQHLVHANNDKDVAHVFDNISLVGVDMIHVVIIRDKKKILYKVSSKIDDYFTKYNDKPVIDPTVVLESGHENYYDLMPCPTFSGAAPSFSGNLQQLGSKRPYILAIQTSTWATANFDVAPGATNFGTLNTATLRGIEMTDAVGRPLAAASATGQLQVGAETLRANSTLVVYTNDGDEHYHRYFHFVG